MLKLAVGPAWTSPFVWTDFTKSALNLRHPEGTEVQWFFGEGWCPARRHTHICEQALDWGADLICFAGADQVYEPDMLERLVARFHEGYQCVSALIPARGYVPWQPMVPFQPLAYRFKRTSSKDISAATIRPYRSLELDGDMLETVSPAHGEMVQVNFIGSGVLLFHRDHLLALERPWFEETYDPQTLRRIANQDGVFVWRLQMEAGAQVWVDTTIKVRHIHPFKIDDTYSRRFSDWIEAPHEPGVAVFG